MNARKAKEDRITKVTGKKRTEKDVLKAIIENLKERRVHYEREVKDLMDLLKKDPMRLRDTGAITRSQAVVHGINATISRLHLGAATYDENREDLVRNLVNMASDTSDTTSLPEAYFRKHFIAELARCIYQMDEWKLPEEN